MAFAYDMDGPDAEDRMDEEAEGREPSDLVARMGEIEGDVSDLLEDDELMRIAGRACEEFDHDRSARREWDATIERAISASRQDATEKNFPFRQSSNLKYPALTTAAIQFGSRAYSAMVKDDQVVKSKIFGADPQGMKAAQGERVTQFVNYQLTQLCDEWDPGTDMMCHALPVQGTMFRKMYWSTARNRPVIDTVSSAKVYVPMDAPSLDQAPRITQVCSYYPFEIQTRIASKVWRNHDFVIDGADSQKSIEYLEEYRYEDLDRDGLPEPYVATIHRETMTIVRLEPAFDPEKLRVWESGAGDALVRDLPWIDYGFLPDPAGGFYSIGFGHLLEPLAAAINALLNQIIDAGTRANAGGGFISQGLKLRAGTVKINPGEFMPINVPAGQVAGSVYEMKFDGPSPVQFQMLEFLLGAAKDITATKDIMTGDIGGQRLAEGTVLALIEQGTQVYSTIHKRLYRSDRRAHRRLFGLNRDFLDQKVYEQVLDIPGADPRKDFDMKGVDVMPISDPGAATDMQRLARANFIGSRMQVAPDQYNLAAGERRILEAARIPNVGELLKDTQQPDPIKALQMEGLKAKVADTKASARLKEAGAAQKYQDAQGAALERGTRTGELAAMADDAGDEGVPEGAEGDGGAPAGDLG